VPIENVVTIKQGNWPSMNNIFMQKLRIQCTEKKNPSKETLVATKSKEVATKSKEGSTLTEG